MTSSFQYLPPWPHIKMGTMSDTIIQNNKKPDSARQTFSEDFSIQGRDKFKIS